MDATIMMQKHYTSSYPQQQPMPQHHEQRQQHQLPVHQHFSSSLPCHPLSTNPSSCSLKEQEQPQERLARQLDDLKDVLLQMRSQEKKYYSDLLLKAATSMSTTIPPSRAYAKLQQQQQAAAALPWKPILIQWMFSVIDIFQLAPQIVPTALYYLDYVVTSQATPPEHTLANSMQYQLLGLTCLELAIKVHDTKVFPLDELVRMGQSGFQPCQIVAMEGQLVQHMNWNLHPPTPHCFVHQYGVLLQALTDASPEVAPAVKISTIVETALQLLRRGIYQQLTQPPAILAYAAMLAAMEQQCGALSESMKQSFCVRMLELTGLSAHSPGLAQAYPVMVGKTSPTTTATASPPSSRVSSPTTIVSGAGAPCTMPSSPGLGHCQQHQHYYQPQPIQPTAMATTLPVYTAQPTLQPQQERPHSSYQPTVMQHEHQQQQPRIQPPNHWYSTAAVSTHATTTGYQSQAPPRAATTVPTAPSLPSQQDPPAPPASQRYIAKPTMIYSAGDDLGFEVTLNDVLEDNEEPTHTAAAAITSSLTSWYNVSHDTDTAAIEDELASEVSSGLSIGGVDLKASLSGSSSSWIESWCSEGVSPRNVTGTASPNRQ